jgi:hypothetical protein
MQHFPSPASTSTVAAYFLHGIEAGLFPFDCAKDWAFGIIEALDVPPIEIIEIACANSRESAFSSLSAVTAGADLSQAGGCLLASVCSQTEGGALAARDAIIMALQVAETTSLPADVRHELHALEDELELAEAGAYSTVTAVTQELVTFLRIQGHRCGGAA